MSFDIVYKNYCAFVHWPLATLPILVSFSSMQQQGPAVSWFAVA